MIDEINGEGTGWARFDGRKLRFRLGRTLDGRPMGHLPNMVWDISSLVLRRRAVFLMLNPSKASAFIMDPTVNRCRSFAMAWGAEVLEVVNIFPLRSTYPDDLLGWTRTMTGGYWEMINNENNAQIVAACTGADRVIAAWGAHGKLLLQGTAIRELCRTNGIKLHHLGLNKDGSPKHPLYIKGGTEPQEWTV